MAALNIYTISVLLSLISSFGSVPILAKNVAMPIPPSCSRIECPSYAVVHAGDKYEIRRYDSAVWMSTSPIEDISLVGATRNGFIQLFDYIQGKNSQKQKIEMTAPVITDVSPGDGPICNSSFVVSFYVPKLNQAKPPSAEGLKAQRWGPTTHVAVRRFGGFVTDSNVGVEAAALHGSLKGSKWGDVVGKAYSVAQYNSPIEFSDRVNEIWMLFDMEDGDTNLLARF